MASVFLMVLVVVQGIRRDYKLIIGQVRQKLTSVVRIGKYLRFPCRWLYNLHSNLLFVPSLWN